MTANLLRNMNKILYVSFNNTGFREVADFVRYTLGRENKH